MRFQPELKALAPWVAAFGITPDTRIATPLEERAASDLVIGDLVHPRDAGTQPITNIREAIAALTKRRHFPVRIAQGALGFGLPRADLNLGPQHRGLFGHIRVPLIFCNDAALMRAKSLATSHANIAVQRTLAPVSFIQKALANQGVIFAEGVRIETVLPDGECTLDYITLRSWELRAAVA